MRRLAISLALSTLISGAFVSASSATDAAPVSAAAEVVQPSTLNLCQILPIPVPAPKPSPTPTPAPAPAPQPVPAPSPSPRPLPTAPDPTGSLGPVLGLICADLPLDPGLDPGLPPLPLPIPALPVPGR